MGRIFYRSGVQVHEFGTAQPLKAYLQEYEKKKNNMKCLSFPVSTAAMERLEYDECTDGDLVEVFLDEVDYKKLWDTGVLNLINDKLGKNIDDYEDEGIIGLNDLYQAQAITNEKILLNPSEDILNKLLSQINLAIERATGIFFYF